MASSSGTPVPAIVRLVAAEEDEEDEEEDAEEDEDTVRDVIHAFTERGLAALDPQWARGRPRLIPDDDIAFILTTATTRPTLQRLYLARETRPTRLPATYTRTHGIRYFHGRSRPRPRPALGHHAAPPRRRSHPCRVEVDQSSPRTPYPST